MLALDWDKTPAEGGSSTPLFPAALSRKRGKKPFNRLYTAVIGVLLLATMVTIGALWLTSHNTTLAPGQVDGAIQSPQTTPAQRQLAIRINAGLDDLRSLMGQVYQDAKQFVGMTNAQLLQASSLSILNDMATKAQYAYAGQLNPSTGQAEGGALWIYGNLQRLAMFDVRQYIPPAH